MIANAVGVRFTIYVSELALERIQTQTAQKETQREEDGTRVYCANKASAE